MMLTFFPCQIRDRKTSLDLKLLNPRSLSEVLESVRDNDCEPHSNVDFDLIGINKCTSIYELFKENNELKLEIDELKM